MARILRGEIRWADLNPVRGSEQAGLRPVLSKGAKIIFLTGRNFFEYEVTYQNLVKEGYTVFDTLITQIGDETRMKKRLQKRKACLADWAGL